MVRPTRWVQETQWRAVRVEEELTAKLCRSHRPAELAEALGISHVEYAEAVRAALALASCFPRASAASASTSRDSARSLAC